MITRPLEINDYHKGYLNLLSQLTVVGKLTEENFATIFAQPNRPITYVIEDFTKRKIVASGSLLLEQKIVHQGGKVAHIEDIVVDSDYRGMGLGKQLIKYLIDMARFLGCYKVILNCKKENVKFYQKCGLEPKEIEMVKYFS